MKAGPDTAIWNAVTGSRCFSCLVNAEEDGVGGDGCGGGDHGMYPGVLEPV